MDKRIALVAKASAPVDKDCAPVAKASALVANGSALVAKGCAPVANASAPDVGGCALVVFAMVFEQKKSLLGGRRDVAVCEGLYFSASEANFGYELVLRTGGSEDGFDVFFYFLCDVTKTCAGGV